MKGNDKFKKVVTSTILASLIGVTGTAAYTAIDAYQDQQTNKKYEMVIDDLNNTISNQNNIIEINGEKIEILQGEVDKQQDKIEEMQIKSELMSAIENTCDGYIRFYDDTHVGYAYKDTAFYKGVENNEIVQAMIMEEGVLTEVNQGQYHCEELSDNNIGSIRESLLYPINYAKFKEKIDNSYIFTSEYSNVNETVTFYVGYGRIIELKILIKTKDGKQESESSIKFDKIKKSEYLAAKAEIDEYITEHVNSLNK